MKFAELGAQVGDIVRRTFRNGDHEGNWREGTIKRIDFPESKIYIEESKTPLYFCDSDDHYSWEIVGKGKRGAEIWVFNDQDYSNLQDLRIRKPDGTWWEFTEDGACGVTKLKKAPCPAWEYDNQEIGPMRKVWP